MGRASFAFLIGVTTLIACSSVPDLRFDDEVDGGGGTDGGEGGVVEGGVVEGGVVEGGIDPNCKPTGAEVCDDGIDNDCDGQVDCQDSQCNAGFSCQDAPPDWTVVGFAGATTPSCPANTAATNLSVTAGDGSASCTCSCTSVGGSCATGSFTLNLSNEGTCGVGATTGSVPKSGACVQLGASFAVPTFATIAPVAGPTACTPNPALNGPITSGRVCEAPRFGGGCGTNQVCAPKPATGFASCIAKNAKNVCPLGFTKRSTAGTSASEMRTCTGCTCALPTACSGGSVSIYGNSMCKTNGGNAGAEGIGTACAGLTPDTGFSATYYSATAPSGGCGAPTVQAIAGGTLSFFAERTVCCK